MGMRQLFYGARNAQNTRPAKLGTNEPEAVKTSTTLPAQGLTSKPFHEMLLDARGRLPRRMGIDMETPGVPARRGEYRTERPTAAVLVEEAKGGGADRLERLFDSLRGDLASTQAIVSCEAAQDLAVMIADQSYPEGVRTRALAIANESDTAKAVLERLGLVSKLKRYDTNETASWLTAIKEGLKVGLRTLAIVTPAMGALTWLVGAPMTKVLEVMLYSGLGCAALFVGVGLIVGTVAILPPIIREELRNMRDKIVPRLPDFDEVNTAARRLMETVEPQPPSLPPFREAQEKGN